jgi:hypothetical protein
MRRIAYKEVFRKIEALWTGVSDDTTTIDAAAINIHFNTWAAKFWESYFWPEWTIAEPRQFRASWASATTYGAPTSTAAVEVYHVRSGHYYQSLRAGNIGHEPEDTAGAANAAWWAQCAGAYSGNDWAASIAYAVGTIVRNPADNRYYQCVIAHTSSASFDATKFGILTPFRRSIDYEQSWEATPVGEVKAIWDKDPQIYFGTACEIGKKLADAIYVAGDQSVVWVEFRLRPPTWSGDPWDSATTYGLGDQVYDDASGDYYASLAAGNIDHAVSDAAYWSRIEMPYVLRDCVAQAVLSALLRVDEEFERANEELALANQFAAVEYTKISRQQGQAARLPFKGSS